VGDPIDGASGTPALAAHDTEITHGTAEAVPRAVERGCKNLGFFYKKTV